MKIFLALLVASLASVHGIEKRSPQFNSANQRTQAFGGVGSTVIASGQANAGLGGLRGGLGGGYGGGLGGGYGGGLGGGYGGGLGGGFGGGGHPGGFGGRLGGFGGQINSAKQNTFASGGAGSVVVADGTANAGVGRERRYLGPYDNLYGGGFPRTNVAQQSSVGLGGDFSTVVVSGTANAGRTKRDVTVAQQSALGDKFVVANGVVSAGREKRIPTEHVPANVRTSDPLGLTSDLSTQLS